MKVMYETPKRPADPLDQIAEGAVICPAQTTRLLITPDEKYATMLIGHNGPNGVQAMVSQDLLRTDMGLVFIDTKSDRVREVAAMARNAGRTCFCFDPGSDNSALFNPLLGGEAEVIEDLVTTYLIMNPDSPQYFKALGELVITNTMKVLKRLDASNGEDGYYSNFVWLSCLLQNINQGRELVNKFIRIWGTTEDEAKENADIASWFLNEYFDPSSEVYQNSSGVRSQMAKVINNRYLGHILNPDIERGDHSQVDFGRALANGEVICICTANELLREMGIFLHALIGLRLKSALAKRIERPALLYYRKGIRSWSIS